MAQVVLRNVLNLMAVLGICVAVYVAWNWSGLPTIQRMVGLFFVGLVLHVWEEMRFPGGFAEMITSRLDFVLTAPHAAEAIVAAYVLYLAFVPLFFPHVAWLAMASILLGVLEAIGHVAAIRLFRCKHYYSPGLVTALALLLPISVYGIAYVVRNDLIRPLDWGCSLLYMVLGLAVAQGTVVRMSGMKYGQFLKRVRSTLFTAQR
jgi:hypothetical protein